MNDLPQRYTALAARKPECAVYALEARPTTLRGSWVRHQAKDEWYLRDDEAEALIFRHLVRMMTSGYELIHSDAGWAVKVAGVPRSWYGFFDDPLLAVLAFWESQP